MKKTNTPPVHKIRFGAVKAAIWENKTKVGVRHSVTVTRLFKDGETWKETTSLGRDDLLVAAKAISLAHSWICAQPKAESAEGKAA